MRRRQLGRVVVMACASLLAAAAVTQIARAMTRLPGEEPAAPAAAQAPAGGSAAPAAPVLAIVGATVIPMDRERTLENHTVIVRDGKIAAMGPAASTKAPAGAQVIDGAGKFVIPGLAEMHGHLQGDNAALNERILLLNAAYGITTLRNMQGHPAHLTLRDRVARGELLGPRIYTAGPQIGGNMKTPELASGAVSAQKQAGFDLLKIQEGLPRPAFDAMAETAHKVKIPFAGHIPGEVGLARALDARYASIDHLDGYVEALVKPGAQVDLVNAGFFGSAVLAHVDESRIAELVKQTKAAGTAVVPTETLIENFFSPEPIETLFGRPELKYLPKEMIAGWEKQKRGFMTGAGNMSAADREKLVAVRRALLKAMQKEGVRITLGSDAPQVLNVPGVAIHRELELMVAAGLTPYEALVTGTRNIADYFGTSRESGTIAAGKRADLLVLEANPLTQIANTQKRFGTVVAGRWLSAAEAAKRLNEGS